MPWVSARLGLWAPIADADNGQALMTAGLIALSCVPATTPLWAVSLPMIPVGVGGSFTVPPLTSLLIGAVPAHRAGTASGVLNMFRQMAGSLSVAAVGTVLATQHDFMTGLRISLIAIAVLVAVTTMRA